ncbi:hypothetical protein [Hyphomicrobium sp. ghe19]|uniref:hypothetical protein n=1 Tax=Hyphomicrobium sp. ghe19 TaxID=2682968 RepID=UPI0030CC4208
MISALSEYPCVPPLMMRMAIKERAARTRIGLGAQPLLAPSDDEVVSIDIDALSSDILERILEDRRSYLMPMALYPWALF